MFGRLDAMLDYVCRRVGVEPHDVLHSKHFSYLLTSVRRALALAAPDVAASGYMFAKWGNLTRPAVTGLIDKAEDGDRKMAIAALEHIGVKPTSVHLVSVRDAQAARDARMWTPPVKYKGAPWTYDPEVARRRAAVIARLG